mmetsp:Transcript_57526/g.136864  ORF Transcript_57526/g.136864 Transcript_57526/m.136864 type:complete len:279 (-) Transcript_57526:243-1079(-)
MPLARENLVLLLDPRALLVVSNLMHVHRELQHGPVVPSLLPLVFILHRLMQLLVQRLCLLRFDEASGQILGNSEVSHRFVEVAVLHVGVATHFQGLSETMGIHEEPSDRRLTARHTLIARQQCFLVALELGMHFAEAQLYPRPEKAGASIHPNHSRQRLCQLLQCLVVLRLDEKFVGVLDQAEQHLELLVLAADLGLVRVSAQGSLVELERTRPVTHLHRRLASESNSHHARLPALPRPAQRDRLEDKSGTARDGRPVACQLVRARLEQHDGGVVRRA